MYKKIIVCVDDTPLSERATRVGADLAQRYGASITLLSVVDPALIAGKTFSGLEAAQMLEQHTHSLTDSTHRMSRLLSEMGVHNTHKVLPGRAVDRVLEVAEQESADLIVVGSESRGRFRAWLDNDLWSALSHKAHCSVLRVTPNSTVEGYNFDGGHGGTAARANSRGGVFTTPLSTL